MAFERLFVAGLVVVWLSAPTTVSAQDPAPTKSPHSARADEPDRPLSDEAQRIHESFKVLTELNATPDNAIPQGLLDRAEAIVVIPQLVKGGFIVGAKHGKGVVSIRDRATNTWSAPAFVNLTGGSIGWQIGVEAVDLVLLVMNEDGINQLLQDRFTIGGGLSVAAGPVGRSADAAANAQMNAGILAYSRAKGLFAGATLEGARLGDDGSANEKFYGKPVTIREITGSAFGPSIPPAAAAWRAGLAGLAGR